MADEVVKETQLLSAEQLEQAKTQLFQMDENIRKMYFELSEEDRAEFITQMSRDYLGEGELANEQLAEADELRRKPGAEGRSHGDVYVAANPLEHIADGMRKYKAKGMRDEARGQKEEINASRTSARERLQAARMGEDPRLSENVITNEEQAAMAGATVDEANAKLGMDIAMRNRPQPTNPPQIPPVSSELQGMQTPDQIMQAKLLRNRGL